MNELLSVEEWQELLIKLAQPFDTMDFLPKVPRDGKALALAAGSRISRKCGFCQGAFATTLGEINKGKGKYCSRRCYFQMRSIRARDPLRIQERFWEEVGKRGGDECWEWKALRAPNGYGIFSIAGKMYAAHRMSFYLEHGEIPEGLFILHKCDNRPCVNPAHLYAGTKKQNTADMFERGRQGHHKRRSLAGSANPNAKLTPAQVQEIIRRFQRGGITRTMLAFEFGVSPSTIGRIVAGEIWKDGARNGTE
jgi:hypothetical protein